MEVSEVPRFEYERFLCLSGGALCKYMEPIANDPSAKLPREVVARLVCDLPTFEDEYHLVYALEMAARFAPDLVIAHVPKYLEDSRGSVWSVASRILTWIPQEYITTDLVSQVHGVAQRNPTKEHLQETYLALNKRMGMAAE